MTPIPESPYFSDEAYRVAREETQSPKSRSTIIVMKPSLFLVMAAPGTDSGKTETVQNLLKQGKKFDTLPYLMFKNNGDGTARVSGHEGRHRCRELKRLGDHAISVIFVSLEGGKGPAIRWGSQDQAFDRVPRWPRVLINEDNNDQIAFPESVMYPHERVEAKEKVLKSWISRDKLTELHLVKDELGYIIQDIKKSPLNKQGPGVKGQKFLNKLSTDSEAIKEFQKLVKEITTPKGLSIKTRKVARIMSQEADTDDKLSVFAKRSKSNKRLKKAGKHKRTHKQISRTLKSHGRKLLETEKRLKTRLDEIQKELKKLDVHKERHQKRILQHIDRMAAARKNKAE